MGVLQVVAVNGLCDASGNLATAIAPLTAGSAVVVCFQNSLDAANFTLSATDTLGNTYSVLQTKNNADDSMCALLVAPNVAAGADTVTCSIGFPVQRFMCGFIIEVGGVLAAPTDSAPAITVGTSTTALCTTTGALAQAVEFGLCFVMGITSATIGIPTGGPTWSDAGGGQITDSDGRRMRAFKGTTAATTAFAPSSTLGSSELWMASVITLKAASAGSDIPVHQPLAQTPQYQGWIAQ